MMASRVPAALHSLPQKDPATSGRVRRAAIGLFAMGLMLAAACVVSLVRFTWWIPLAFVMAGFALALVTLIVAAFMLETNPNMRIALIALGLTCFSFAYQPFGPEIGRWGTECVDLADCGHVLRGAGFPLQYVLDSPGITYTDHLGVEDVFRVRPLILDVLFYFALVRFAYRLNLSRFRS